MPVAVGRVRTRNGVRSTSLCVYHDGDEITQFSDVCLTTVGALARRATLRSGTRRSSPCLLFVDVLRTGALINGRAGLVVRRQGARALLVVRGRRERVYYRVRHAKVIFRSYRVGDMDDHGVRFDLLARYYEVRK